MTSSNENSFHVTDHLCGEFTGHRWIPHTKASDGALMFSLIFAWINGYVNNGEAGDLRRHRADSLTVSTAKQPVKCLPRTEGLWVEALIFTANVVLKV